jgi:hypothetical protein
MHIVKHKKLAIMKTSVLTLLFTIGLFSCADKKLKNGFFVNMKEHYKDLYYEKDHIYLKNFGLSNEKFLINGKQYKKLSCDLKSVFYLKGYIRMDSTLVFLFPLNYKNADSTTEGKLFDFKCTTGDQWTVFLSPRSTSNVCLDVVALGIFKEDGQDIYKYKLTPYIDRVYGSTEQKDELGYQHIVEVSKTDGIRKIKTIMEKLNDTIFECTLYPKEKLVFNGWSARPL